MSDFEFVKSKIIERIRKASSDKKRRQLIEKLVKKPKKKRSVKRTKRFDYDKNNKWNKNVIVSVLKDIQKEYGKITVPLLRKLRKKEPQKYPAPTSVIYKFGSWKEVKKHVGGLAYPFYSDVLDNKYELDYFLDLYNRFGITKRELYHEARRKYPEIVPPYGRLLRVCGNFTNFKRLASISSCSAQITRLVYLVESLDGRWPKRALCREHDIDIPYLDKKLQGRKELKSFVRELRSIMLNGDNQIAKQKGSSRKGRKTI